MVTAIIRSPAFSVFFFLTQAFALVMIGFCVLASLLPTTVEMIPSGVGTYWVYDFDSREQGAGTEVKTVKTKHKLTVLEEVTRPGIKIALVEKKDLSGREPLAYVVRQVFNNDRFYEYDVAAEERESEWVTLRNSVAAGQMPEVPEENCLQMVLPAKVGTFWDNEGTPDRTDGMYCWRIEKIGSTQVFREIAGIRVPHNTAEYTMAFRTCPDHQLRTYVPGLGFTNMQYRHHGTVLDTDEHLIEFHQCAR